VFVVLLAALAEMYMQGVSTRTDQSRTHVVRIVPNAESWLRAVPDHLADPAMVRYKEGDGARFACDRRRRGRRAGQQP
jgi:hypothetical protein